MERVIIIGGGPTGLWLGSELALAGVDVTILEERAQRDPISKGFTIQPRTLELWASRGIVDRFLELGTAVPNSHLALLDNRLDYRALDTPFPYILILGQPKVEELLEEHALEAGVDIRRGHTFRGLVQHADSVEVRVATSGGEYELEAGYLVGCDGVRSPVREAAGIGFPGSESTAGAWIADVRLEAPPDSAFYQKTTSAGSLLVVPLSSAQYRIAGIEPVPDRAGNLTTGDLKAKVAAVAGTDFGLTESYWVSWTGTDNRLAERCRAGRIFLAGDAAHRIYPAGGQGLNVGVQDAANLGWKLAAAIPGRAAGEILDSYHDERHAVGADLMDSIRAQMPLMTQFSGDMMALRSMLNTMIGEVPEFSRRLATKSSGLDVAYRPPSPDAHPLVGHRAPNLVLADGTRLFSALTPARHVLLDLTGGGALLPLAADAAARSAEPVEDRAAWGGVRGALIRPDGHVAWASDETGDDALYAAAESALEVTRPSSAGARGLPHRRAERKR
jgi:2-polyprenyl-6-methoxyphenol hydroxylase-like FAD-dependent oxidoreductase